jgi:H+/Cl- antiporter ClcA
MNLLQAYQEKAIHVMHIFRWDLQLPFFLGFVLTLLGFYRSPLYSAGVGVTLIKEALDLWSRGRWSWDDVWCGLVGSGMALGISIFKTVHRGSDERIRRNKKGLSVAPNVG